MKLHMRIASSHSKQDIGKGWGEIVNRKSGSSFFHLLSFVFKVNLSKLMLVYLEAYFSDGLANSTV